MSKNTKILKQIYFTVHQELYKVLKIQNTGSHLVQLAQIPKKIISLNLTFVNKCFTNFSRLLLLFFEYKNLQKLDFVNI